MLSMELFNKALTAASVAEAQGFLETSKAFQEIALTIYGEFDPTLSGLTWFGGACATESTDLAR